MQNKRFTFNIIKNDIVAGFSANKYKFIFAILLFTCIIFFTFNDLNNFINTETTNYSLSVTDVWFNVFKGVGIYIPSNESPFKIPFLWFIIQTIIAYLIISYPTQDLYTYGVQKLLRCKNRKIWWISKCIWNMCTVLSIYIFSFVCILVFLAVNGDFSFSFNLDFSNQYNSLDMSISDIILAYFVIYLMPVITSIVLSQIQIVISFIVTPIFGFIVLCVYSIISAYYCSYFCFGNFSMILRSTTFGMDGVDALPSMIISAFVTAITIICGMFYINSFDILKKGRTK